MKPLSKRMKMSLMWMTMNEPPATVGRPMHHENLITHNALLRRGLIEEANDDFHTTTLTPAGRLEIEKLKAAGWKPGQEP